MNLLEKDDRITVRKAGTPAPGGRSVVYWMQRSQRGVDNHALDAAVRAANELKLPCVVYFAPIPFYPHANLRHYAFLQQGIPDMAADLKKRKVGFVLRPYPEHSLQRFLEEAAPALLIGDENPMREPEHWREVVTRRVKCPFYTVDADVIVPTKLLLKEQFAAYTIRPRLQRELKRFLVPYKNPKATVEWKLPRGMFSLDAARFAVAGSDITSGWKIDRSVKPVTSFLGGHKEAMKLLHEFVTKKLKKYDAQRNHPEIDGTSRMSPYLHFGHISPVTVALAVNAADAPAAQKESYLDEMITWRELAINFVKFNPDYDSIECADRWARESLAEHARDMRDVLYSEAELERAETHDPLWNAAQRQMLRDGWMHNYMRMYWAKKILEWSPSPAAAYNAATRLNDKYFLDGRDPNGYAGVAWAIAGKHDRAWFDRPVFGKVRYMSGASAAKKFDAKAYIRQMGSDEENKKGQMSLL